MSAAAPSWWTKLSATIAERAAEQPWQVPLLLRGSDRDGASTLLLPHDWDARPADRRPFRIASVTKIHVAAALFALAEQGRLSLDAPLARVSGDDTIRQLRERGYDPDAMTVAQVMRHSAGLRDHALSSDYHDRLVAGPDKRWTRGEQLALAMELGPPLAPPGEAFEYSDTGYVLLGEVIERTTGDGLATALPALLRFADLGLADTHWENPDVPPALERQYQGGVESTRWHASFDLYGGGGLVSTLADLDTFLRALFAGRIIGRSTLDAIARDAMIASDDPAFGHNGLMFRGRLHGEDVWAHTGYWGVQAAILPARGIVLAATFNRAPEDGAYGKNELLVDFAAAVAGEGAGA